MGTKMNVIKLTFAAAMASTMLSAPIAHADDATPTPGYEHKPAVDGYHVGFGGTAGVIGGRNIYLATVSASAAIPFVDSLGIQLDLAGGARDGDRAVASGLHIFWRNPDVAMFGAYGDYANGSPHHGGRVGGEFALYLDRFTLDGVAGMAFGQDIATRFFDEIDLNYYVTDDLRASIGHRYTSRGHVGNAAVEWKLPVESASVRLFAEGEFGEDDYSAGFAGLRMSFGSSGPKTLIEEDRENGVRTRVPRNFASISYCTEKSDGTDIFCGSKDEVRARIRAANPVDAVAP